MFGVVVGLRGHRRDHEAARHPHRLGRGPFGMLHVFQDFQDRDSVRAVVGEGGETGQVRGLAGLQIGVVGEGVADLLGFGKLEPSATPWRFGSGTEALPMNQPMSENAAIV